MQEKKTVIIYGTPPVYVKLESLDANKTNELRISKILSSF